MNDQYVSLHFRSVRPKLYFLDYTRVLGDNLIGGNILQMRNVNVFAAVPDCETDVWTRIAEAALKLNKQDFLDSSLADYKEFNPSLSQPDLRVGTQSVTKASPSERSGKRSADEDDVDLAGNELEQFHYEYKIGTQNEVEESDIFATVAAISSQTVPGSSTSSGRNPEGVKSTTPHTPSSRNRPAKKRKLDPLAALAETLKGVMEEQAKLREQQENDRIESRRFKEASNQMLENITKAFMEEQRLTREEQKINQAMWQEYLLKNQAAPIAALPPTDTTPQLMIGNNPSGSNDSVVSIPKSDNAGPPPLPVGLPESTPCPPPPPVVETPNCKYSFTNTLS